MKAEHKTKWLDALRSGEFEQTTGQLRCALRVDDDGVYREGAVIGYCCLGVFLQAAGDGDWEGDTWYDNLVTEEQTAEDDEANYRDGDFSRAMLENYGLTAAEQAMLVGMNDGGVKPGQDTEELLFTELERFHKYSFEEIADWIEENL